MRELNKEEKIQVLNMSIDMIEAQSSIGICHAFKRSAYCLNPTLLICASDNILDLVPEVLQFKPDGVDEGDFWFEKSFSGRAITETGKQKRIEILNELINKLNK